MKSKKKTRYKGVSLLQHENGNWYYQFTINRRTELKSLNTTILGEAKAKLDLGLLDKVNRMRLGLGKSNELSKITLYEAVEEFLEDNNTKVDHNRLYLSNLERIVNEFMNVIGKGVMLSEICAPHKQQYKQWLRKHKPEQSRGGFNHRLKLLKVFDNWCTEYYNLERKMLSINRKDLLENNDSLERFVSEDNWINVCKNIDKGWLIHYFRFGYYLGLRRGEIVKMQLRDDGKLWIYGKRGKVRKLPMPESLIEDYAYIVSHRDGKSFRPLCDEISRGWKRAAKKAKVYLPCGCGFDNWAEYKRGEPCPMCQQPFHILGNGKTFHGTRHAFISRSLEDGINQLVVSRMVGHSNLDTTNRYITMSDDYLFDKLTSNKTEGLLDDKNQKWFASIGKEIIN